MKAIAKGLVDRHTKKSIEGGKEKTAVTEDFKLFAVTQDIEVGDEVTALEQPNRKWTLGDKLDLKEAKKKREFTWVKILGEISPKAVERMNIQDGDEIEGYMGDGPEWENSTGKMIKLLAEEWHDKFIVKCNNCNAYH